MFSSKQISLQMTIKLSSEYLSGNCCRLYCDIINIRSATEKALLSLKEAAERGEEAEV